MGLFNNMKRKTECLASCGLVLFIFFLAFSIALHNDNGANSIETGIESTNPLTRAHVVLQALVLITMILFSGYVCYILYRICVDKAERKKHIIEEVREVEN